MRAKKTVVSVVGVVVALLFLFPTYWMISTAFKPTGQIITSSYDLVPLGLTLQHFVDAITKPNFLTNVGNSLVVTLGAVAFSLVAGLLAAVPLARLRFRGRKGFLLLVLVAQMAPLEALLIPMYLMMRDLGLLNQLPSLLLVYFAATLPFTAWTLRGFVAGIPVDLEEAAMVDGCGRWAAFRRVTLPLLGPGLVATSVFGFITAWNEFIYAFVFMRDQDNYTLPVWLASFSDQFGTDWGGTMAASTLFTLPVLAFFLIVQRNLVGGVAAGAVKG
ncbi:carbohydrate ABC transporter permease [Goodfellowiella coeruleoviolacea]|uniref:Carbohydrate ABC transporter membrane protein 2, CUT1 family (TC 3.A.1.1.-) n=1 Tax=Goodfellowiella coeruleoviolacea TaxID=334858 RepID=A0AAE3GCC1_9PSEU|nr:carbohydrate ABC transporter permease [Goodfellowiella coeruleoviolacea]MCP2164784.1 carbohydrate ABC transporter membrane protein 2, CUT1 family (TC 3.A.1.1.-) [Goodfellowiella coeruleoviolacea]